MTTTAPDFGTDLSCLDDLTEDMAEVSGAMVVAQATYRRLSTPRGSIWNGPEGLNYGYDLRDLLSTQVDAQRLSTMPAQIKTQILKDDRISSATVTVTQPDLLSLAVAISCETALGPFEEVLTVDKAAVVLTSVTAGGG